MGWIYSDTGVLEEACTQVEIVSSRALLVFMGRGNETQWKHL